MKRIQNKTLFLVTLLGASTLYSEEHKVQEAIDATKNKLNFSNNY